MIARHRDKCIGDRSPLPRQQFARRRIGDDPPAVHHQHAVSEDQRLGHVVRHHDGGETELVVELADRGAELIARHRIERAERLIEKQQSGRGSERAGDADALPLTARQGIGHPTCEILRQIDQIEQVGDAGAGRLFACQPQADRDILGHGHVREQADILKDIADSAAQRVRGGSRHRLLADPHHAFAGLDQAVDHLQQRGFARAGRADQRHETATGNRYGHIIHGSHAAAIAFRHTVEGDRRADVVRW